MTETAFKTVRRLDGHDGVINRLAWSPAQNELASTSFDRKIMLWNLAKETTRQELAGHRDWVSSVSWSPDGTLLASSSGDSTIRIWDTNICQTIKIISGHDRTVFAVDWAHQTNTLASASGDGSVGVWDPHSGNLVHLLRGHANAVYAVRWSPNGRTLASGSEDHTIRVWDGMTGNLMHILQGHTAAIYALAWSPDGSILASASADYTIRIAGRRTAVLEGHTDYVSDLSFSADGLFLASKSMDGTVRIWRTDNWQCVETVQALASRYWTPGIAFHPRLNYLALLEAEDTRIQVRRYNINILQEANAIEQTVRYTNAKVALVGDSGVGKTGLAEVLCGKTWRPTDSTHGRKVWRFHHEEKFIDPTTSEIHEILLWDMAGQPGYHLIHQLHLNQVVLGLIMFDTKGNNDPLLSVRDWDRALRHAQSVQQANMQASDRMALKTFLIAGRIDRSGTGVTQDRINRVMRDLHFDAYFPTSAREGRNVKELAAAIRDAIDWDSLPKVSSTKLFQRIKSYLADVREGKDGKTPSEEAVNGSTAHLHLLYTVDQLFDTFMLKYREETSEYSDKELRQQFETCIGLVESQGLIKRFSFGDLVLLQPEMVDAYASAIITTAKDETGGLGSISLDDALAGNFELSDDERIPDEAQERRLLIATVEDLIRYEIALRDEESEGKVNLVFPSQSSRSFDGHVPEPDVDTAIWDFEGPVLNIYNTLLVRLWNTRIFQYRELYENAAFFTTESGANFQIFFQPRESGTAELKLFSDKQSGGDVRLRVGEFIDSHLQRRSVPGKVQRRQVITCHKCGRAMNEEHVRSHLSEGHNTMPCWFCATAVSLSPASRRSSAQQSFVRQRMVRRLDQKADEQLRRQIEVTRLPGKELYRDFDVFLCHNHADAEFVAHVGESLKAEGILPWLDIWEIEGGDTWSEEVQRQLKVTKNLAFFLGNNGRGEVQMKELHYAMHYSVRVIPVLLPDTPRIPDIPIQLIDKSWIDYRQQHPDPLDKLIRAIIMRSTDDGSVSVT